VRYTKGKIGRVLVVKFDDRDILIEKLKGLAKKERLKAAVMVFIGALKEGDLVTGPKKPLIPPEANQLKFSGGWEVMGVGTIFHGKSGHMIHIHGSMGKKHKALTGCVRGRSRVFLVVEAVIFELKGVRAKKELDPETGINLLSIF